MDSSQLWLHLNNSDTQLAGKPTLFSATTSSIACCIQTGARVPFVRPKHRMSRDFCATLYLSERNMLRKKKSLENNTQRAFYVRHALSWISYGSRQSYTLPQQSRYVIVRLLAVCTLKYRHNRFVSLKKEY